MADAEDEDEDEDEDEQMLVVYPIDDAVAAGSYSPLAGPADELGARWGPRVDRDQIDSSLDATSCLMVELPQLPGRGRGQCDLVAHANPRSALTSSQGIGASPVACISARACSAARMSAMSSASARTWSSRQRR